MIDSDMFLDELFKKLKIREKPIVDLPKIELREPPESPSNRRLKYYAVDGGSGMVKLEGGQTLYVARAVAVSRDELVRDLNAEINYWHSKPLLEAMRSEVEVGVALNAPSDVVLMDGSYYTMITKWITRVVRIAFMKAKLSEIASLPFTLRALASLGELVSKKKTVFISKNPSFKLFKNYYLLRELYERTRKSKYYVLSKDPILLKKELLADLSDESVRKYALLLLNSAITDMDLLKGEGISNALELPLPKQLRRLAFHLKWDEVIKMAIEYYEMSLGETMERVAVDLCAFRAPRLWWFKRDGVALTIEEPTGPSLCAAGSVNEIEKFPDLALEFLSKETPYPPLLEVAHMMSTLSSAQMAAYARMVASVVDLKIEKLREELISLSKGGIRGKSR